MRNDLNSMYIYEGAETMEGEGFIWKGRSGFRKGLRIENCSKVFIIKTKYRELLRTDLSNPTRIGFGDP